MPTRGNTQIQQYERDKRKHLYHGSTRVLHPVLECAVLPVLYQYTGTTVVVRKYVCVSISDKPPNTTVHVWATLKCDVLRDWVVVCVACSTYSTAAYLVLARECLPLNLPSPPAPLAPSEQNPFFLGG